jgi:hypothetical protein
MSEIRPGVKYTFAELEGFRENPSLRDWAAKGYVWRQELDGTLKLVHWSKSHMDNEVKNPRGYADTRTMEEIFPTEPIKKRTPQERKDSLINRWWESCKKAGTVPGLSDEQLTNLFGREWKTGVSEITYADIERMASAMLQEAENKA